MTGSISGGLCLVVVVLLAITPAAPPDTSPISAAEGAATGEAETRRALIATALSLRGVGYSNSWDDRLGFRPDCSGTMNYIYRQVVGVDIGSTTFDQLPRLQPIELAQAQDGDLWYGQFEDQHTGMLWRQPDGSWALIHNGADAGEVHVTPDFLDTYLGQHTIGFRRALP